MSFCQSMDKEELTSSKRLEEVEQKQNPDLEYYGGIVRTYGCPSDNALYAIYYHARICGQEIH